jgi:hypothetical protein
MARARLAIMIGVFFGGLAIVACSGAPDDNAATGNDQNIEEVPCRPAAEVVCHTGEHTISTAACGPGLARCMTDGCEAPTLFHCTAGYVVTTASCKGKTARCTSAGTLADAGHDAAHDARKD